nr:hypothetical protein [Pseudomonas massiliensis]
MAKSLDHVMKGLPPARQQMIEQRGAELIAEHTLREYVEAMGGTLELVARLPGRGPVRLEGLGDLNADLK